jgi:5-methyltetrahydropteroyltriglutamate--homocysteine methyltransferase
MATRSTNLGFPRIGPDRELKKAVEAHWAGRLDESGLQAVARDLRRQNWQLQADRGIDHIPSNDFSLSDHVLDMACLFGAVPERYGLHDGPLDLATYFAMARGGHLGDTEVTALEMTKWFDTNYHYLVPELSPGQAFVARPERLLGEIAEAAALGITTRPVLLGPISFLLLAKHTDSDPFAPLSSLVTAYASVLSSLASAGVDWVQVDEPVLCRDLDADVVARFAPTYAALAEASGSVQLLLATYFSGLRRNLDTALGLPVDAVHLDIVSEPGQLAAALDVLPAERALSVGIVDGRNVWRTDLAAALTTLEGVRDRIGPDRLLVGPSCSLLHIPVDLDRETELDPDLRSWMAFGTQRLDEVALLTRGLNEGREAIAAELEASSAAADARRRSTKVHDLNTAERLATTTPSMERRISPYPERIGSQRAQLGIPTLPTTTIGSFPQTAELRSLRSRFRRGDIDHVAYDQGLHVFIRDAIAFQEEIDLDVLVHGEPERTDMVEHFGLLLDGFAVTRNGWVQSYGSRCVKPPVIFGDVSRPLPMTVIWSSFAQSLTDRPVKGMLTGPITILAWSFVRDDQPLADTCRQIALAIRDEVVDLETAGIRVIQIDEPALRELLPLHAEDHKDYLAWAVGAFRLAASGVQDATQIHTHMCYAEFNEIIEAIAAFDADVISIEASRSRMELLGAFTDFEYPNEIGPGVFDIHSPRVPSTEEMVDLIEAARRVIPADRLWVNPDCGLKTRTWDEVRPSLANMVEAARIVRGRIESS